MTKLRILLEENPEGVQAEWVWATILKNGNYRIENCPLADGINYRDIVKADYVEDILTFRSVVIRSGYLAEKVDGQP